MTDITDDADWILTAQLPDGAIARYTDRLKVVPYFSHFAAMGLTRAYQVSGNPSYATAAWRWLDWYAAKMDATGYVTDYNIGAAPGYALTSTNDMDSTDSYAAMLLVAARKLWKATSDTARLTTLSTAIDKAVTAIESTQESDGLTWAKPSYHVKYLMDQAEAWAGLVAAVELAGAVNLPALKARASSAADRMAAGVASLWNGTSFNWAKFEGGNTSPCDWAIMYPDAASQVWPVAFGLVRGARAKSVVAKFDTEQPSWDVPTAASGAGVVGYWPVIGWAFTQAGQQARGRAAAVSIRTAGITAGRAWPHTTAIAGQLAMSPFEDRLPRGCLV